jgi:serine/threonine-protein kinase
MDARVAAGLAPALRVERLLGQGSTARIYLARDVALDLPVTVKVLDPQLAGSAEARARFEREARAAANIIHPNVANVRRYGVLPDGDPYLVMQYVRGRSLDDRLAAEGPLGVAEVRSLVGDVARGLESAHKRGVVHRDIRPGNILLEQDTGRALVTDFGLAALTEAWGRTEDTRLTKAGQLLGDPNYVSPEQLRGEAITEATDIYSLAVVAYEALTGRKPHRPPLEFPAWLYSEDPTLATLLGRCLSAEPARRPSARSVAHRLARTATSAARVAGDGAAEPGWLERWWGALVRGRVPQWTAGAAAGGWLVLQAIDQLIQNGLVPAILYRVTLSSVLAGVAIAAILAWYHGESGEQRFRASEVWLLLFVAAAWVASLVAIL